MRCIPPTCPVVTPVSRFPRLRLCAHHVRTFSEHLFVCLGASAATTDFNHRTLCSLCFLALINGLSLFLSCSETPVIKRCNYLSPVSTHRVPCFFVAVMGTNAFSWAHSSGLSDECVFLLLKAACDQTQQLFRSCVLTLTECFFSLLLWGEAITWAMWALTEWCFLCNKGAALLLHQNFCWLSTNRRHE